MKNTTFFGGADRAEHPYHPERSYHTKARRRTLGNRNEAIPPSPIVLTLATFLLLFSAKAEPIPDPAPPTLNRVSEDSPIPTPIDQERLTSHAAPKGRHTEATDSDWPRFLGPKDNATSPETHLLDQFPEDGLKIVWELEKGEGYTSPVIAEDRLVFFHSLDGNETIECRDPETGLGYWSHDYPIQYRDRYGFQNGPRASPLIDSGKAYTLGVTGVLSCLDLKTGTLLWERRLAEEFDVAPYFFGFGSCPLIHEGKLIVPMGTDQMKEGLAVVAFDQNTGGLVWATRHRWNASYASPIIAEAQGKDRLFAFMGGESDPAFGGLLAIEPEDGTLLDEFAWRPDKYESVNSSTPIALGDDRIFISTSYSHGGTVLRLNEDLKFEQLWDAPGFGLHWMTPLALDGHLYGFPGRNEPDASFACFRISDGAEVWREDPQWSISISDSRDYNLRYFRGSLLQADGKSWALGELGSLGLFDLSPTGPKELDRTQLFLAQATWSLTVLHRGLLYISQHEPDFLTKTAPRLICYDLRK